MRAGRRGEISWVHKCGEEEEKPGQTEQSGRARERGQVVGSRSGKVLESASSDHMSVRR